MKNLAYFLVLFVGIQTHADKVANPSQAPTDNYGVDLNCYRNRQGEIYTQMMHWRTFVVFYMARCSREDSAEVGQYVTNIGGYLQRKTPLSTHAEKFLAEHHIKMDNTGSKEGSAYGSPRADICGTQLANRYENQHNAQGSSAFCGANRAKYQALLADKSVESVKHKAAEAVCADTDIFKMGVCHPQDNRANFDSAPNTKPAPRSGSDLVATATPPSSGPGAVRDGNTGGSEEMRAANSQTRPASAPAAATTTNNNTAVAANNSPYPNTLATAKAGDGAADNDAPPKEVQMASLENGGGQRHPRGRSAKRGKNKVVPNAVNTTGTGAVDDNQNNNAGDQQTAQAGAKGVNDKVAGGNTSAASAQAPSLDKIEYKRIFSTSPACKKNAEEIRSNKMAHFDASITSYYTNCKIAAEDRNVASQMLSRYQTLFANGLRGRYNVTQELSNAYKAVENKTAAGPASSYCNERANFFKDVTRTPDQDKIENFVNNTMCK